MLQTRLDSGSRAILLALACMIATVLPVSAASTHKKKGEKTALQEIAGFLSKKNPVREEEPKVCEALLKAAEIAEQNASSRTRYRCWRYVKRALVAAEAVNSYPGTVYAKEAGRELTTHYNFVQLEGIEDPAAAPVGSVLVYGGRGAGHVEFRTEEGFVSDFFSNKPSSRPLIGVYVKGAMEADATTLAEKR